MTSTIISYNNDVLTNILGSFAIGLIFAPFNRGLLYLIIWFILWEIIYFAIFREYNFVKRFIYILSSLLGFYIGRLVIGDNDILSDKKIDFLKF